MRVLGVEIYKSRYGDCSNHGISSKYDEILVECPTGPTEIDEKNPPENLCKIVTRNLFGREYKHVEPVARPKGVGWMASGCLVNTSDSRWRELTGIDYPLKLHDRCESQEMYNAMSN